MVTGVVVVAISYVIRQEAGYNLNRSPVHLKFQTLKTFFDNVFLPLCMLYYKEPSVQILKLF